MSIPARIAIPGLPQHLTQRANRSQAIPFEDNAHEIYPEPAG